MQSKYILLPIIAITIILSMASCSIQEISVGKPKNVKVDNLNLSGIKISGEIPINNTNNFGFNIKGVKLDIAVNGLQVGSLNKKEKIHIKPNSNTAYPINYEASFKEIVKDPVALRNALSKGSGTIKLTGHVTASKFIISKKIKIEHEEKIGKFKLF